MFDLLRKSLLMGLGAAVVTREKIDQATKQFVEQGKINKEEAEKLAHELLQSGEKQWEELQGAFRETAGKVLSGMDIPKNQEFQDLRARVEKLEKRLSEVEIMVGKLSGKE